MALPLRPISRATLNQLQSLAFPLQQSCRSSHLQSIRQSLKIHHIRSYAKSSATKTTSYKSAPTTSRYAAPIKPTKASFAAAAAPPPSPHVMSVEEILARKGSTVLYLSYNRSYVVVCYSLAAIAGSWAFVEFYEHVLNMPDAPLWTRSVSSISAGLGLLMVGLGLYFPSRLVRSITTIPRHPTASLLTPLEVTVVTRTITPFKTSTYRVPTSAVTLGDPFYKRPIIDEAPRNLTGLSGMIQRIGYRSTKAWEVVRKLARREDMVQMFIKDKGASPYYLNRDGFAWDRERKGLDRLFKPHYRTFVRAGI